MSIESFWFLLLARVNGNKSLAFKFINDKSSNHRAAGISGAADVVIFVF